MSRLMTERTFERNAVDRQLNNTLSTTHRLKSNRGALQALLIAKAYETTNKDVNVLDSVLRQYYRLYHPNPTEYEFL